MPRAAPKRVRTAVAGRESPAAAAAAAAAASLADLAAQAARDYAAKTTETSRRDRGQVFTPAAVARLIARAAGEIPRRVRLLDPGAGTGTLTAAFCDRVAALTSPRVVAATLFESDPHVLAALEAVLRACRERLAARGHRFDYVVRAADFLASDEAAPRGGTLFDAPAVEPFDVVVMNPPYLKLSGASQAARDMADVVHGQPNAYALFMAAAADLLAPGGRLAAITPRSFCNGLYFRAFRRKFFADVAPTALHLFESRRAAFAESDVLQESLISTFAPSATAPAAVAVSSSEGPDDAVDAVALEVPRAVVLDPLDADCVLRVPTSMADLAAMRAVEAFGAKFSERGLTVSTGPVVAFRSADALFERDGRGRCPLITIHNVKPFATAWPAPRAGRPQYADPERLPAGSVLRDENVVLLRRFSAKEEARRLTAAPFLAGVDADGAACAAFENHVNVVRGADRPLSRDETLGLCACLNSRLLDRYFRVLSGNTQVNATELRTMPFPDRAALAAIGRAYAEAPAAERAAIADRAMADDRATKRPRRTSRAVG